MKVLVDTSVLLFLIDPTADAPIDPATNRPVTHGRERVQGLLEDLDKSKSAMLVPTPVLSELLINARDQTTEYLAVVHGQKAIQVVAFDESAAAENAILRQGHLTRKRARAALKREGTKKEVSFDLQIVAMAKVEDVDYVLTDDGNMRERCLEAGLFVKGVADLPIPAHAMQGKLLDADGTPTVEARGVAAAPPDATPEIAGPDPAANDSTDDLVPAQPATVKPLDPPSKTQH